jgi:hypothetical protein
MILCSKGTYPSLRLSETPNVVSELFCNSCMQDYWLSIDRFVNWSSTAVGKNDFYTDWEARMMYKAHLLAFTSRNNSINGKIYRCGQEARFFCSMTTPFAVHRTRGKTRKQHPKVVAPAGKDVGRKCNCKTEFANKIREACMMYMAHTIAFMSRNNSINGKIWWYVTSRNNSINRKIYRCVTPSFSSPLLCLSHCLCLRASARMHPGVYAVRGWGVCTRAFVSLSICLFVHDLS